MNPKASATLEKACEDRHRSHFKKALDRLEEGVEKFPGEFPLYTEAIDVGMEAGESLRAIQIFKKAQLKFRDEAFEIWTFTAEKVGTYNDSIMGRFLLEHAVKNGDLAAASSILENLKDHAVSELVERIRTKKQTMSVALGSGPAAREEIALFTLTEALLSLRLGCLPAAMDGFVEALEESPGAAKKIEPFLADFESRHDESGEMSFALGCCLVARADYSQGLAKLARATRSTPSLAPRVIERIESLEESPDLSPDLRDLTLAQLYMGQGDRGRASRILKKIIERTPLRAADAVDLLRTAVEQIDEDLETHFIFVEAAFAASRRETALGHLRKIYKDKRHTNRLVEWLESRTKSQSGSTEVQLFFAETALNEGLYGKAIEIFKEILSRGPQEDPMIRELLSKHQSVPGVRAFYNERFGASPAREKESAFELERYETNGFPPRAADPETEKEPKTHQPDGALPSGSDTSFRPVESPFDRAASGPRQSGEGSSPDFENHDFSLSMHDAAPHRTAEKPARDGGRADTGAVREENDRGQGENDGGEGYDLFEYLKRSFTKKDERGAEDTPVPVGMTPPVEAVPPADTAGPADAIFSFDAAAASDEHAADEDAPEPEAPAPDEADLAPTDVEILRNPAADEITPEEPATEEPRDFDSLYRAFLDGRLDHNRILEVAERAFDESRMDEMKRLLAFEPANLGEDIARKFQLARYYLAEDQPLPALVALRAVHLNSLGRDERKDFMLRIAECYGALHNFDAAHGVYLRIMTEHPGLPDVEHMARSNYARYIETAAGIPAALEKTTTL